jgi:hypothetical protein
VDPDPRGPKTGSGSGSATLLVLKTQISQNGKIFYFLNAEEKKLGQFSKNYRIFFSQKIVTKLSKVWVWDQGSEIRDPEKTYSGSRIRIQGQKCT